MKKKTTPSPTGASTPWNNPFAGLKLDLPKEPETPPPPPSPEEQRKNLLSKEDQELLAAFGGASTLSVGHDTPEKPHGPRLSFNIQRKGKGGKTVTLVYGLKELEQTEQMTLGLDSRKRWEPVRVSRTAFFKFKVTSATAHVRGSPNKVSTAEACFATNS